METNIVCIRIYGKRKFFGLSSMREQVQINVLWPKNERIPQIGENFEVDFGDCTSIKVKINKISTSVIIHKPHEGCDPKGLFYYGTLILFCYGNKEMIKIMKNHSDRDNCTYFVQKLKV